MVDSGAASSRDLVRRAPQVEPVRRRRDSCGKAEKWTCLAIHSRLDGAACRLLL